MFVPGNTPVSLWLWVGVIALYRAHASAPDWGRQRNIFLFSGVVISVCILFQKMSIFPVLAGRYGAHATALNARDYPDWRPDIYICITIMLVYKYILYSRREFLWYWSGGMVHMLRQYTHKTVLIVGQRYKYMYLY